MPDHPRSEAWAILSEEIARLPETYRSPVVLCYLEAMSYQAAAASLGVTEDTVRGRLARARKRLRKSLGRRGVEVPAILGAARPASVVPAGLAQATARAAAGLSAGGAAGLEAISQSAISLCERTCRTMMLTKLKAVAAALVLGIITAGAIVSAQPPEGGRAVPSDLTTKTGRPVRTVPARGGNLIVDWIPADGQGGKKEITVDPKRHCIHLPHGPTNLMRDDRLNDGMVHLDLERGKTYTVTASGEAFMSEQTGADADPFAGVVVPYCTDEEDTFAERYIVLTSGKSITFRSPLVADGYVRAFFLDSWPGHPKRGSYTLTIEEAGEQAAADHIIKAPFDAVIIRRVQGVASKAAEVPGPSASPDRPAAKAR
jgi:Sigma-70, region 4